MARILGGTRKELVGMAKPRKLILILSVLLSAGAALQAAAALKPPLEAIEFGTGVFAGEDEFVLGKPDKAVKQLMAVFEESDDMARHFRAIRRFSQVTGGEYLPRLRELYGELRKDKSVKTRLDLAYVLGLLLTVDTPEARPAYLRELAVTLDNLKKDAPANPWGRFLASVYFGTVGELSGNWFDEALYAFSNGYDETPLLLALGSYLLYMDLVYGGNDRLQWLAYLALTRAIELSSGNERLCACIRAMAAYNMAMPGYRSAKWLKALAGL